MRILIIGSGCSATYLALLLSKNDININIDMLSKETIIGKKFLVTGNGRCNLANKEINEYSYNNEITKNIVLNFDESKIKQFLNDNGVELTSLNNLIYPYSLSAKVYREQLINNLMLNRINILNKTILDYKLKENEVEVQFNDEIKKYDKLIFAAGGLKKDNEIYNLLINHKYTISNLNPGLCPIKVKENVGSLTNLRVKCTVMLYINDLLSYKEDGEVLFKKDGLSGIAIMNTSSLIARSLDSSNSYKIKLDLIPSLSVDELYIKFKKYSKNGMDCPLNAFFDKNISSFIVKRNKLNTKVKLDDDDLYSLAYTCKNLDFNYLKNYDYSFSQVVVGGLSYSNLNIDTLESNSEKNVYFIGEILNADGLCGGYNLMFCFASSYLVFKSIIQHQ